MGLTRAPSPTPPRPGPATPTQGGHTFQPNLFITIIIIVLFLFFSLSWEQITYALEQTPINLAKEEIIELNGQDNFKTLSQEELLSAKQVCS